MGIQIDAQVNSDSEYIGAIDKYYATRFLNDFTLFWIKMIYRTETMVQERINSILGLLPDWLYFRFTPHGRKLQSYLDIVHNFTRKVFYFV